MHLYKHLSKHDDVKRGKIESGEFESNITNSKRRIDVYLPPGYDGNQERYSVAYIHSGQLAQEWGDIPNSLDNLIAKRISPVIAVFIHEKAGEVGNETYWNGRQKYAKMLVEELVPFVDANYRTIPSKESRANIGMGFSGFVALYSTLRYSDVFAKVSCQSTVIWIFEREVSALKEIMPKAEEHPLEIYFEWGKYDFRVPAAGWSVKERNMVLAKALTDSGYALAGGEVNDGFGWPSWRNRTDVILETFFPLSSTSTEGK